jgi:hypothetical protein
LILWCILTQETKRRWSPYNQILFGISFFDLLSSTGFALATLPVPEELGVYGAQGNEATCKTQGFMIQVSIRIHHQDISQILYKPPKLTPIYINRMTAWSSEHVLQCCSIRILPSHDQIQLDRKKICRNEQVDPRNRVGDWCSPGMRINSFSPGRLSMVLFTDSTLC